MAVMRAQELQSTRLLWQAKDRVSGTSFGQNVSYQVLLAIVCGQNGYLVRRVALETHVHEEGYCIFCLRQILGREGEGREGEEEGGRNGGGRKR